MKEVLSNQIETGIHEIDEWKEERICWLDVVDKYFKEDYEVVADGY